MKRKIRILLAGILAALAVTFVAATPAHASTTWWCPSGGVGTGTIVGCLYVNSNGGGSVWLVNQTQGCKNLPAVPPPYSGNWNDVISSWLNHTGSHYKMTIWEDSNCRNASRSILPDTQMNLSWPWNDAASSYAVYPGY